MKSKYSFLFLLGLMVILLSLNSMGCTCFGAANAKTMRDVAIFYSEGAKDAAAFHGPGAQAPKNIFEGLVEKQELIAGSIWPPDTAMSMTSDGDHRVASIHVLHSYRGQANGTVKIVTGLGDGDCGFDFETGKQYLIYATEVEPGTFFTSICTGTSALEEAGTKLRFLRGEAPTTEDLMDPRTYYEKVYPTFTATACGRVTQENGMPAGKVEVDMTQVRDEPFPPKSASDPNLSKADGTFCVRGISPGRYVLTAETTDFDHDFRWMGYYPGTSQRSHAKIIEITPGANLQGLNFSVRKQSLYTVSFRIVASDGSPLPLEDLGIIIQGHDRDALGYQLDQHLRDGEYTVGYVPPGAYSVRTIPWGEPAKEKLDEIAKWRMTEQEVTINSDTEIVLKLEPANNVPAK